MAASAKPAECVDGQLGLLGCGADDIETAVAQRQIDIRPAGLTLAALDNAGQFDRLTAESKRTGASARVRAKLPASGSASRMATSAEV